MSDINNPFAAMSADSARASMMEAYMNPETPEQTAQRFQKARIYDVEPTQVEAITPEEEASRRTQEVEWLRLQALSPVLTEMVSQPALANLYKDNLTDASNMERLIYALSPETGEKDGIWGTMRNAFTRSGFGALDITPIFGRQANAEALGKELSKLDDLKARIDAGEDVSAEFTTAEDATGQVGMQAFVLDYERQRNQILEGLKELSIDAARATQYANLFPANKAVQKFSASKGLDEALDALGESPLQIVADVGVSSLVQNAPMLAAVALTGGGIGMQSAGAFLTSFASDREAGMAEGLAEDVGVDWTNPQSIFDAFTDPAKRDKIAKVADDARTHALGTAIMDAASVGVASKTLLPKSMTQSLFDNVYKREFANVLAQAPVQGAMGGAGEALGQFMTDGEISSWSDVVAEMVGEQFTAPVEVFSTGMRARIEQAMEAQRSERKMEAAKALAEALNKSKVGQLDPETEDEHIRRAVTHAGISEATIDARAFAQMKLHERFRGMPGFERASQAFARAFVTGGDFHVDGTTFVRMLQQAPDIMGIASLHQEASPADAKAAVEEAATASPETSITDQKPITPEQQAVADKLRADQEFTWGVASVGREVGADLRKLGITRAEAAGIQAIIQTMVGATAKDAGYTPQELWKAFGFRILDETQVNGKATPGTKGEFFPSLRAIGRWKTADRSTLLHEVAHAFLELRFAVAGNLPVIRTKNGEPPAGQQALLGSTAALLQWLGVDSLGAWQSLSVEQKRDAHEKFARSFEAYVMQGRTPSSGLKKHFRNFSRWLTGIYQVVGNIPGAEMNPEVREMFDALFLAHEQVRVAAARQNTSVLFASPEEAGMSPVEWETYNEYREAVFDDAVAAMTTRNAELFETLEKRRQRLLQSERKKALQKDFREQLESSKYGKAWKAIRFPAEKDGKKVYAKLFKDDVIKLGFSEESYNRLRNAHLATVQSFRCTVPIDELASSFGFSGPKELVETLLETPDLNAAVKDEVNRRLEEGLITTQMEQEVQDRVAEKLFDVSRLKLLTMELNALERMERHTKYTEQAPFETVAYELVSKMKTNELHPIEYVRAANRAARNSRKAWKKGDLRAAIFFKRQELYQAAMAKVSREAKEEIRKGKRKLLRLKKKELPGVDSKFLELAKYALVKLGIFTERQVHVNPTEATFKDKLVALETEQDMPIDADPMLVKAITERDAGYISTVGHWQDFMDFMDQLVTLGRRSRTITLTGEKLAIEEIEKAGAAHVHLVAEEKGVDVKHRSEEEGWAKKMRDSLERFGFNHWRASTFFAVLDGGTDGLLTKLFIHSADRCATEEESLKNEYTERLYKILSPLYKSFADREKRESKVFGAAFSTQEVFVALLNYGNEGNRQRLLKTIEHRSGRPITEPLRNPDEKARLEAEQALELSMRTFFAEYLSREHFEAAQKAWNVFADMQKKTESVARRVMGRAPVWVKPRTFVATLPDGGEYVLTGGYYPIVYDRESSLQGAELDGLLAVDDTRPANQRNSVNDGHLKERLLYFDAPITLTARALFEGLESQIHYVSWSEWTVQTAKIINRKTPGSILEAVRQRYGSKYGLF